MQFRVILLALGGLTLAREAALPAQAFVTTAAVRLRGTPSEAASTTRVLATGERVLLLRDAPVQGYFQVQTDRNEVGWVRGRYLVPPQLPRAEARAALPEATAAAESRYPACGGERHYRWAAKIAPPQSHPAVPVSVSTMLRWARLPIGSVDLESWCAPRMARELGAFTVTGWVRRVMTGESDGDWHVEITGQPNSPVSDCAVVEIPNPSFDARFQQLRDHLVQLLMSAGSNVSGDISPAVRVRFVGPAFYDGWHSTASNPRGHGRCNATPGAVWEIHPVMRVVAP